MELARPHNPTRYGETWDGDRLERMLAELSVVQLQVVVTDGWA